MDVFRLCTRQRQVNLREQVEDAGSFEAVKRMGGRISLESRPGEGSSFCIELKKAE